MAVLQKIKTGLAWRWNMFRRYTWHALGWSNPRLAIWLRWPWPMCRPWQRKKLRIATYSGVGDELMATAVIREIKRRNPDCHLTFITRRPDTFQHLPYIDAVELTTPGNRSHTIFLSYVPDENVAPPPRPLVSLMAENVGLIMPAVELDAPQLEVPSELQARIASIPGPRIVIQPLASSWSPNKNWPVSLWVELIKLLTRDYSVIEVGTEGCLPAVDFGSRFHSFVGQTDLAGFAHIISQAAVFVGPVSGGMHFANAFQVPAVIIVGGYELPTGYQYPRSTMFFSPVPCAPCWLIKPCPFELKCLKAIRPAAVAEAVYRAASGKTVFEVIKSQPQEKPDVPVK